MAISATEISELIKKKIQDFDLDTETRTEGAIVSLSDRHCAHSWPERRHAGRDA